MSAKYTSHPIEPALLAQLWARLWDRGIEELNRLGFTMDTGFHHFLSMAEQAEQGEILCADDVPVSATGIYRDDGAYVSFFQAAQDFNDHAWEITERLVARSEAIAEPIFIYSVLVHPATERWFKVLGYQRDDWRGTTAAGWPLYRFRKD